MSKILALVALSWSLVGCFETSVDIREDNDSYTCETGDEPCEPEFTDAVIVRDACDVIGTTNLLVGACWWEQCRDREKSLYPKPQGVPCVTKPSGGNSPWVEGVCNGAGVCVGSVP